MFMAAVIKVKKHFPKLPIFFGGAGGFIPDTIAPQVWPKTAVTLAQI